MPRLGRIGVAPALGAALSIMDAARAGRQILLLETVQGLQNKRVRAQVASALYGRQVHSYEDLADYFNLRYALMEVLGAGKAGGSVAKQDKDFELRAAALLSRAERPAVPQPYKFDAWLRDLSYWLLRAGRSRDEFCPGAPADRRSVLVDEKLQQLYRRGVPAKSAVESLTKEDP